MLGDYIAYNKIFYHPDRIDAYLKGDIVRPISVKMRLTDACNLKCYYCSYKDNLNSGSIDFENALKVLEKLSQIGVRSIVFTGGEPTCYRYFKDVVKAAKEIFDFDLGLITNGVIYPDVLEYLTWVRFSLDTVDAKTFERIKGVNALSSVLSNINRVIQQKSTSNPELTVGIQAVVNRYNFDYMFKAIKDIIEYAINVKADYFQIRPLENDKYDEGELHIIKDNLITLKRSDQKIKILCTDYKWDEVANGYVKEYEGCPSADFIGSVDVKGDFYICCAMINDETAKYGNLLKDKTRYILENRKAVQGKFDYSKCTLACQGSLFNRTLNSFKNIKHKNFI